MAVSKRLRFEVLRRDRFMCRYCGRSAQENELNVDHVVPASLGGTDTVDNLVAACPDCNAGKSSTVLDSDAFAAITEGGNLWREAVAHAAEEKHALLPEVENACNELDVRWCGWTYKDRFGNDQDVPLGEDWRSSVKVWIVRGLPLEVLLDSIPKAMKRDKVAIESKWRYYCGIVWNELRRLEDRAAEIIKEANDWRETVGDSIYAEDEIEAAAEEDTG